MEIVDLARAEAVYAERKHTAWDRFTGKVLIGLAGLALIGLTLIVTYDVVMRNFFNAPTRWAYEIGKYLLAVSVLFGAAHTMAMDQMIRVDVLYANLSESVRNRLNLIGTFCGFVFSGTIVYASAQFAWQSYESGSTSLDLGIPLYLSQALVPIASFTLAVQCVVQFFKAVNAVRAQARQQ